SSCPASCRASANSSVDGRDKPGHDGAWRLSSELEPRSGVGRFARSLVPLGADQLGADQPPHRIAEIDAIGVAKVLRGQDRFARGGAREVEQLLSQRAGEKTAGERRSEQAPVDLNEEIGAGPLGQLALLVEEHDLVAAGKRLLALHFAVVELPPCGLVVEERVLLVEALIGNDEAPYRVPGRKINRRRGDGDP